MNRDFVLAAKVAGEGTWGIIRREIMPNMVSRIAAGFVFVFYGSIIFAAGLEFLGFGDVNKTSWGVIALLGAEQLERAAGRVVALRLPGRRDRAHRGRARLHQLRRRRALQPAPAPAAATAAAAARARQRPRRPPRRGGADDATCSTGRCARLPPVQTESLVELRQLVVDYAVPGRRRAGSRPRRPRHPRRRDRRPRGRVRLRQDDDGERDPPDPARARAGHERRDPLPGREPGRPEPRAAAPLPLAERLDGLPERDERAQPRDARSATSSST